MNNDPVAIRYDFDGYGYQYMDSGSGSDWQTRVKGEFLYTHPANTLTDDVLMQLYEAADYSPESYLEEARAILKKASEK